MGNYKRFSGATGRRSNSGLLTTLFKLYNFICLLETAALTRWEIKQGVKREVAKPGGCTVYRVLIGFHALVNVREQ